METRQPDNPYVEPLVPASEPFDRTREIALGKRVLFWCALFGVSVFMGLALVQVRPAIAFAGLFGTVSVAIILRKPYWGLLIYVAVFLLRPGELHAGLARLRLEFLIGTITLAGLAYQQYYRDGRLSIDRTWQTKLLLLFIVAAVLSVPLSYWRSESVGGVMTLLKILAFYVMVVHLVDTRKRLRAFFWVFLTLTVYVIGSSFQGTVYIKQGVERVYGVTSAVGGPNALGATVAATFPLLFLLFVYKPLRGLRPVLLGCCIMSVYVLSTTGSRSGVLGFIAGLICLWWMLPRRALTAIIGVAVLATIFAVLPDQYQDRYSTMTSAALDASSRGRIETWKDGLSMVADRPLLGVGINAFSAAHYIRDGWALDAHSMYLQILSEVGFLGALPYFGFLFQMLLLNRYTARLLSNQREWQFECVVLNGLFAGLLALLVTATFGTQYIKRTWYIYGAIQLVILRCYMDHQVRSVAASPQAESLTPRGSDTHILPSSLT